MQDTIEMYVTGYEKLQEEKKRKNNLGLEALI